MISGRLLHIKSLRFTCLTHEEWSLIRRAGHDAHTKKCVEGKYRHFCSKTLYWLIEWTFLLFYVIGFVLFESWQAFYSFYDLWWRLRKEIKIIKSNVIVVIYSALSLNNILRCSGALFVFIWRQNPESDFGTTIIVIAWHFLMSHFTQTFKCVQLQKHILGLFYITSGVISKWNSTSPFVEIFCTNLQ